MMLPVVGSISYEGSRAADLRHAPEHAAVRVAGQADPGQSRGPVLIVPRKVKELAS